MSHNNFLITIRSHSSLSWLLFFLFGAMIGILVNTSLLMAVAGLFFLIILFFAKQIQLGLLSLVACGFFINWGIDFSRYGWARELPYLPTINAPIADFIGLLLVGAILSAGFFNPNWFKEKCKLLQKTSGFYPYLFFLFSALVAALVADPGTKNLAIKFWFRPYVFVYLVFVATFIFGLKNPGQDLARFIRLMAGLGLFGAVFGLSSFLFAPQITGAWRAVPYGLWGFAPLGYNHNLLAEVLVTFLPCFLILLAWSRLKNKNQTQVVSTDFYGWSLALVLIVALLTLSRAAWLASAATFLVWYYLGSKNQAFVFLKKNQARFFPAIIILVALFSYMVYFLGTSTVASSTIARFDMTKIVGFYTMNAPWFGYGPGAFVDLIKNTALFGLEYGDPLDAHGFIFKIILETGIIGLGLFSYFLGSIIRALRLAYYGAASEIERVLFRGLLAMVVGSIVFQLFNTSYLNSVFWIPLGLASAALAYKGKINS